MMEARKISVMDNECTCIQDESRGWKDCPVHGGTMALPGVKTVMTDTFGPHQYGPSVTDKSIMQRWMTEVVLCGLVDPRKPLEAQKSPKLAALYLESKIRVEFDKEAEESQPPKKLEYSAVAKINGAEIPEHENTSG